MANLIIPEAKQAGFDQKPTRFAPKFNGVSSYALLPNIQLEVGDVVSFDFISPFQLSSSIRMMLSSTEAYVTLVRMDSDGELVVSEPFIFDESSVQIMPLDGEVHSVEITMAKSRLLNLVAAQSNGTGGYLRFADFPIFNLKVNDGSVYNYPMNESWSEYPIMRNAGSGPDGQYFNMTQANVIEVVA